VKYTQPYVEALTPCRTGRGEPEGRKTGNRKFGKYLRSSEPNDPTTKKEEWKNGYDWKAKVVRTYQQHHQRNPRSRGRLPRRELMPEEVRLRLILELAEAGRDQDWRMIFDIIGDLANKDERFEK